MFLLLLMLLRSLTLWLLPLLLWPLLLLALLLRSLCLLMLLRVPDVVVQPGVAAVQPYAAGRLDVVGKIFENVDLDPIDAAGFSAHFDGMQYDFVGPSQLDAVRLYLHWHDMRLLYVMLKPYLYLHDAPFPDVLYLQKTLVLIFTR